jgi:hypothetical protein
MAFRRMGWAAAAAAAVASTPPPSASVVLSTHRAAARPVGVTLLLRYGMQCAWPGKGPLQVLFPAALRVPAKIPPAAVLLDGKPAASVVRSGRRVLLALPPRPAVLCDVIAPGTLKVEFTRAATLGNPSAPGTYVLRVRKGSLALDAKIVIRP